MAAKAKKATEKTVAPSGDKSAALETVLQRI